MSRLKSVFNHPLFFPIIILYYGAMYLSFGETYPSKLGTDGFVYASFVSDYTNSFFFDTYYVHRVLPSFLIRGIFKVAGIAPDTQHIFSAFQLLNLACLALSSWFLKLLFMHFRIALKVQLLAFALFFVNFGMLKFPFYFPVMTDTPALLLSTMLLYFYVKNNISGLILTTFALAFTWPMGYYQGLILIALPIMKLPFIQPLRWQQIALYVFSGVFISVLIGFLIFIEKMDTTLALVMRIDRTLLPLSIIALVLIYVFAIKLFFNKALLDLHRFFSGLNYPRIIISFLVFAGVIFVIHLLHPKQIAVYSTAYMLANPTIHGLIKPFIPIVSIGSYFGVIGCFIILFWNPFCKVITTMGWGITCAIALNIFLFAGSPESRQLINLLPWIVVVLAIVLNSYVLPNTFYIIVFLLCAFASKLWLHIGYQNDSCPVDQNGSVGFPNQKLWLNIGPWMSEQMYYLQGGIMFVVLLLLFFMIYRIRKDNGKWAIENKWPVRQVTE
jgi:hypothetical protein